MSDDIDTMADAIIEDTVHCTVCGAAWVLGGNDPTVILDQRGPHPFCDQVKLCESCSIAAVSQWWDDVIPHDEEIMWILGRPNFWCASIAARLRRLGHEIRERAEDEQAHVIAWMLGMHLRHGNVWRDAAVEVLRGDQPTGEAKP